MIESDSDIQRLS